MLDPALFATLMSARDRLFSVEAQHGNSLAVHRLHRQALRVTHAFKHLMSDEQFAQLAAPQGGGTPKSDEPVDGD